ncbi:MAG: hypothetical protein HY261_07880, partial [Chloroflexi bacterium]|nr:hypothetical protein [Chloroflexota bacterium]
MVGGRNRRTTINGKPKASNRGNIMRVIVTVSDKTNLAPFIKVLASKGHQVYSTGGTRKALEQAGVKIGAVSDITGFPEILDGRVKTLHPNIHAGLLASRNNRAHIQ